MKSKVLNEILASLPSIRDTVEKHTQYFNFEAAAKGKKEDLWLGEELYPEVTERNFVCACRARRAFTYSCARRL